MLGLLRWQRRAKPGRTGRAPTSWRCWKFRSEPCDQWPFTNWGPLKRRLCNVKLPFTEQDNLKTQDIVNCKLNINLIYWHPSWRIYFKINTKLVITLCLLWESRWMFQPYFLTLSPKEAISSSRFWRVMIVSWTMCIFSISPFLSDSCSN